MPSRLVKVDLSGLDDLTMRTTTPRADTLVKVDLSGLDDIAPPRPVVSVTPAVRPPVPSSTTTQFITDASGNLPAPVIQQPRASMVTSALPATATDVPRIAGQGPPGGPIPIQPRRRMFPDVTPPVPVAAQPSSTAVASPRPTVAGPTPDEAKARAEQARTLTVPVTWAGIVSTLAQIPGLEALPDLVASLPGPKDILPPDMQHEADRLGQIILQNNPMIPGVEKVVSYLMDRPVRMKRIKEEGLGEKAFGVAVNVGQTIPFIWTGAGLTAGLSKSIATDAGLGIMGTRALQSAVAFGTTGLLPKTDEPYTLGNVVNNVVVASAEGALFALPEALIVKIGGAKVMREMSAGQVREKLLEAGVKPETIQKAQDLATSYVLNKASTKIAGAAGAGAVAGGLTAVRGGDKEDVAASALIVAALPFMHNRVPEGDFKAAGEGIRQQMANEIGKVGFTPSEARGPGLLTASPVVTTPGTSPTGRTTVEPARSSLATLESARSAIQEADRLTAERAQTPVSEPPAAVPAPPTPGATPEPRSILSAPPARVEDAQARTAEAVARKAEAEAKVAEANVEEIAARSSMVTAKGAEPAGNPNEMAVLPESITPEMKQTLEYDLRRISADDREFFADHLQRILDKRGNLRWEDISQDISNQLFTNEFGIIKILFSENPQDAIDIIGGKYSNAEPGGKAIPTGTLAPAGQPEGVQPRATLAGEPAGATEPVKVGDPVRIMGIDAVLAKTERIDGIDYELYNAAQLKDKRAVLRVVDVDSGKPVTLTSFPTYDQGEISYNKAVVDAKVISEQPLAQTATRPATGPVEAAKPATAKKPAFREFLALTGREVPKTSKDPAFKGMKAEYDAWDGMSVPTVAQTVPVKRVPKPKSGPDVKMPEHNIENLRTFFAPGRIVDSYGGGKDRVVSFNDNVPVFEWSVKVQAVDKAGNDIPGERPRDHSTRPSRKEMVDYLRAQPPPATPAPAVAPSRPAVVEATPVEAGHEALVQKYADGLLKKAPAGPRESFVKVGTDFVNAIDKKDVKTLRAWMNGINPGLNRLFTQVTGLPAKTQKEASASIRSLDPETWDAWQSGKKKPEAVSTGQPSAPPATTTVGEPEGRAATRPDVAAGREATGKQPWEMTREEYAGKPTEAEQLPVWKVAYMRRTAKPPYPFGRENAEVVARTAQQARDTVQGRTEGRVTVTATKKTEIVKKYDPELEGRQNDHRVLVNRALIEGDLSPVDYVRLHEADYGPLEKFAPEAAKRTEEVMAEVAVGRKVEGGKTVEPPAASAPAAEKPTAVDAWGSAFSAADKNRAESTPAPLAEDAAGSKFDVMPSVGERSKPDIPTDPEEIADRIADLQTEKTDLEDAVKDARDDAKDEPSEDSREALREAKGELKEWKAEFDGELKGLLKASRKSAGKPVAATPPVAASEPVKSAAESAGAKPPYMLTREEYTAQRFGILPAIRLNGEDVHVGKPGQSHFQIQDTLPPDWFKQETEAGWVDKNGTFLNNSQAQKIVVALEGIPSKKWTGFEGHSASVSEYAKDRHGKAIQAALASGDLSPVDYARLHEADYGPLEKFAPEAKPPEVATVRYAETAYLPTPEQRAAMSPAQLLFVDKVEGEIQGLREQRQQVEESIQGTRTKPTKAEKENALLSLADEIKNLGSINPEKEGGEFTDWSSGKRHTYLYALGVFKKGRAGTVDEMLEHLRKYRPDLGVKTVRDLADALQKGDGPLFGQPIEGGALAHGELLRAIDQIDTKIDDAEDGIREVVLESTAKPGAPTRTEKTEAGDQFLIPGTEGRKVPTTAKRSAEDQGLSGLPLSLEGQEAAKTEQGGLFEGKPPDKPPRKPSAGAMGIVIQRDANLAKFMEGSKVVDSKGKPLVVYHGTPAEDFDEFKEVGQSRERWGNRGHYFTPSPEKASDYAVQTVSGVARLVPVYLSIKNPKTLSLGDSSLITPSQMRAMIEDGYDGVIGIDQDGKPSEFVAFSPTQIKSATGNRGTFDATNPSIMGIVAPGFSSPEPVKSRHAFPDADIEEAYNRSKGVKPPSLSEQISSIFDAARKATRDFPELERTGEFAPLRFDLHKLEKQKGVSSAKAIKSLDEIVDGLKAKPADFDLFGRKVYLDDLAYEDEQGRILPHGWDSDKLADARSKIDDTVSKNVTVQDALTARRKTWDALKSDYIGAMKDIGFDVKDRFNNPNYFRHQVLEYTTMKGLFGTGAKLKTPTGRGFLKAREGYAGDINTDYLQTDYEVMSQMLYDIQVAKTIKGVDDRYNIVDDLKNRAKAQNKKALMGVFRDMAKDVEPTKKQVEEAYGRKVDIQEVVAESLFRQTLNTRQAMGFARLKKLAEGYEDPKTGEVQTLPRSPDGRFDEIIDALAESQEEQRAENVNAADMEETPHAVGLPDELYPGLFQYLGWLLREHPKTAAGGAAAQIFKGMGFKRAFTKETLTKLGQFKTWRDLIPDGYETWQPREGNLFYQSDSIPAQVAKQIAEGALSEVLSPGQIRKVLAMGGKREEFVVKSEVAATLNALTKTGPQHGITGQASKAVTSALKRAWLSGPYRFAKYTIRNMTGDAEAVFVGNPVAFAKSKQAVLDIYKSMIRGEMSPEFKEWFERGGLGSTLQVQELGELNELKPFLQLFQKHGGIEKVPGKVWDKYWRTIRLTSDFRESILRYGAYLDNLEYMQAHGGKPRNFQASIPEEVMALEDHRDRAFKLSNDLLGAYDEVSFAGKELREHIYPFWSWVEVNMRRYKRLFQNAAAEKTLGRKLGAKSAFMALRLGKFALTAVALRSALEAWNRLMFPDEDDDLSQDVKERAHIVFGRDKNGQVRYFSRMGALDDAVEWVGMAGAPQYVRDYINGRRTLKEIGIDMAKTPVSKFAGGLGVGKIAAELLTGREIYPDLFKSRGIRDRGLYLARTLGLDNEYKALAGKPSRGYGKGLPADLAIYRVDPMESAYNAMYDEKARFMKNKGKAVGEGAWWNPKSAALYNLRVTSRYGDKEAQKKYLLEYANLGGTPGGLKTSIENMSPTSGLKPKDAKEFVASLDNDGKRRMALALRFYSEVILGTSPEHMVIENVDLFKGNPEAEKDFLPMLIRLRARGQDDEFEALLRKVSPTGSIKPVLEKYGLTVKEFKQRVATAKENDGIKWIEGEPAFNDVLSKMEASLKTLSPTVLRGTTAEEVSKFWWKENKSMRDAIAGALRGRIKQLKKYGLDDHVLARIALQRARGEIPYREAADD